MFKTDLLKGKKMLITSGGSGLGKSNCLCKPCWPIQHYTILHYCKS